MAPEKAEAEPPAEAPSATEAAVKPPAAEPTPTAEEWATRFKYLYADFENYRRRTERERDRSLEAGRARVLKGMLPILEAFDHAREAARRLPKKDPLREGIELLAKSWDTFLAEEHVEPVARVGELFHPDDEEAVAEVPAKEPKLDGTVAEIVQQGYRSDLGVLRAAKVVVARTPAPPPAPEPERGASEPSA
jgi:molecular chaperone GrpE